MEVTLEYKYIIFIFIEFLVNGCTAKIHPGKDYSTLKIEKVSDAQEDVALHWPKGIVTYYLDNLYYDNFIAQTLRKAMSSLEDASCVRFKPSLTKPSGNMSWINFTNPQGERNCVHEPTFMNTGEIVVVLGFDCMKANEILHTLLHAIGVKDEVGHPQRDQYIRVMWDNIQPEFRHLYRIRSTGELSSTMLVEYDPLSIMHFHDRAFSRNGHATVMPLVPGLVISPSYDLSQLDKMRLRILFDHECNKRKVGDIIDTCKMIVTESTKPNTQNVSEHVANSTSEGEDENNDLSEGSNVDETEEVSKNQTTSQSVENSNDNNELESEDELKDPKKDFKPVKVIHSENISNKSVPIQNNEKKEEDNEE